MTKVGSFEDRISVFEFSTAHHHIKGSELHITREGSPKTIVIKKDEKT